MYLYSTLPIPKSQIYFTFLDRNTKPTWHTPLFLCKQPYIFNNSVIFVPNTTVLPINTHSCLFIPKSSENAEFGFLQVLHFQLAKFKKCPHSRAYHLCNLHNDIFHHSLAATGGQMCVSRVLYNLYNDIFHHSFVATSLALHRLEC